MHWLKLPLKWVFSTTVSSAAVTICELLFKIILTINMYAVKYAVNDGGESRGR